MKTGRWHSTVSKIEGLSSIIPNTAATPRFQESELAIFFRIRFDSNPTDITPPASCNPIVFVRQGCKMYRPNQFHTTLAALFFSASLILHFAAKGIEPDDLDCAKAVSSWSPAFSAIKYQWETFQNGFSQKSIYRGQPTAELEIAWLESLPSNPILISKDKLNELQLHDQDYLEANGEFEGNVYGNLEVFRNLGCLNLLRQHTYRGEFDYSFLRSFQGSEEMIMRRVDACVQRLREVLMCSGDATPYLIMLTPEKKTKESPDFNTLHYCRDYDAILDWAKDNEAPSHGHFPDWYEFAIV
ncbi:hypothetical protein F5B22DRAFT_228666 [Xylaria bambusicola]|uniref:uncharacterized protein n=1 Tax=Xylaria bambusicola TaxID=326684 RepID=UPI002007B744|nr:uncharacterized protein F5B22DRAFT_228666 [Xylaria bambusicola]KAI0514742.1 hypothetical protein F5B22DRAFT_228666 [Xylaria bambusicola]